MRQRSSRRTTGRQALTVGMWVAGGAACLLVAAGILYGIYHLVGERWAAVAVAVVVLMFLSVGSEGW